MCSVLEYNNAYVGTESYQNKTVCRKARSGWRRDK